MIKGIAVALSVATLCGCGTTLTNKAAGIQVHNQMSSLVANCKNLGPVSAKETSYNRGSDGAISEAKVRLREQVADKGGDTLVVLNTDVLGRWDASVQGTALRCY